MAPVCIGCRLAMRPLKNGVVVEQMGDLGGYSLWHADSWQCPNCGNRVIVGFARIPISEHWMPNWKAEIEANPDRLKFWHTPEEMRASGAMMPPPLDIRTVAFENFREQAENVTDPEQKAQLLESLRTAERVAK